MSQVLCIIHLSLYSFFYTPSIVETFFKLVPILKQTDPNIPVTEVAMSRRVVIAARHIRRGLNAALQPLGIDYGQFVALHMIELASRESSIAGPSVLADLLDMSRTQTTRVLGSLEKKGLLLRTIDDDDRRRILLVLTENGMECLLRARDKSTQAHIQIWSNMSPESIEAMEKMLEHIDSNVMQLMQTKL